MANAYPITASEGQEIRTLRGKGVTWEAIAERLGRSRQGIVRYARKELGISARELAAPSKVKNLTRENTSVHGRQASSTRHRSSPVDLNANLGSGYVAPGSGPIGLLDDRSSQNFSGAGSFNLRRSGRTTDQMVKSPRKTIYIWCNDKLEYPRRLANYLGRGDIRVVPYSWIAESDFRRLKTFDQKDIVWDHSIKEKP